MQRRLRKSLYQGKILSARKYHDATESWYLYGRQTLDSGIRPCLTNKPLADNMLNFSMQKFFNSIARSTGCRLRYVITKKSYFKSRNNLTFAWNFCWKPSAKSVDSWPSALQAAYLTLGCWSVKKGKILSTRLGNMFNICLWHPSPTAEIAMRPAWRYRQSSEKQF